MRILLADDHELIRAGLRFLLEKQKGWQVCGEAADGRIAVKLAEECAPDVVILDMTMPELNGVEAARQIHRRLPRCGILFYTMHETERIIVDALDAGARGIVLKSDPSENIVSAVKSIARGHRFFTSHVAETVVDAYLGKKNVSTVDVDTQVTLTSREQEVIQLLAQGKSNKEVANRLFISTRTAEGHRAEIMKRLKLGSVAELTLYAVRNNIVHP